MKERRPAESGRLRIRMPQGVPPFKRQGSRNERNRWYGEVVCRQGRRKNSRLSCFRSTFFRHGAGDFGSHESGRNHYRPRQLYPHTSHIGRDSARYRFITKTSSNKSIQKMNEAIVQWFYSLIHFSKLVYPT